MRSWGNMVNTRGAAVNGAGKCDRACKRAAGGAERARVLGVRAKFQRAVAGPTCEVWKSSALKTQGGWVLVARSVRRLKGMPPRKA